jgi:hypothetical protein
MPDVMPPVPREPFDINKSNGDKPIARLPTLGTRSGGSLYPSPGISGVEDYHLAIHAAMGDLRQTSRDVNDSLAEAAKALGAEPPQALAYARLSFMPDPANYGLMQWPGMQPESLRKVARENTLPQMVIRSRVADLRRYSSLSTHAQVPGWTISLRDPSSTPSRDDLKDIREAERFIANCSREQAYNDPRERDSHHIQSFENFLCGAIDDSLTFDGWAIWTDRDNAGRIRSFANLPAGLIRLALPDRGYKGNPDVFAALVDETGSPAAAFTRDEMTWCVRNIRNDPNVIGYGFPETEMAIRIIQGFMSAIELNVSTFDRNCYSEDTEVLTKDGWKTFGEVDISKDTFATLNTDNGEMEYQKATHHTWSEYDGDMYWMKSRSVDLFVTPEHRVVIKNRNDWLRGDRSYVVYSAADLHGTLQRFTQRSREQFCLPTTATWTGVEIADKYFEPSDRGPGQDRGYVSGDDYCAFMGMYLSEGNLTRRSANGREDKTRIDIHQNEKSKGFKPFKQLIARIMNREPSYDRNRFSMGWISLASHLSQFGNNCYDKHIPQEILDATPRQQKIFWDYFVHGDGTITHQQSVNSKCPHRHECVYTSSKVMADQLQEIAIKMGFAATINTTEPRNIGRFINGIAVKSSVANYGVHLKTSTGHSMTMEQGAYKGMIGCVSVPNGTLYVRRHGKAVWCGNSIPNGILKLVGDFWTQEQIDALQREWINMKRGVSKMWGLPVIAVPEDGDIEMVSFMDMKGQEIRYKDHLNLMGGVYCIITQFPIRRWGMFASGSHRDNQPAQDQSTEIQGVDDPGLPAHLIFIEHRINEYLLWANWPKLIFRFEAKNPKEDARRYSERTKTRTWGEARAENDLPTLESLADAELKPFAKLLSLIPEDPALVGAYQSMAGTMLEKMLGIANDGTDDAQPGAPNPGLKDPAQSQAHGHRVGVPRSAAKERARAKASEGTTA